MTAELRSIVANVEAAVNGSDPQRRLDMLRQMTDLFVGQAARLSDDQVAAFDAVILQLTHAIESEARAELSVRLADIANAPRDVVHDLAFDASATVAGPVLERSARLSEDDLVRVAERQGQGQLLALTRRSTLSERVTSVLLVRGDREVTRSVAGNTGALFSEQGHMTLLGRAADDPVLRSHLEQRADIPPAYRKRIVELAQHHAECALSAEFGSLSADAVSKAAARLRTPARDNLLLAAEVEVSAKARKANLNELVIGEWLQNGQETEALVALARLASVPSEIALRAYEAESDEPLLMLVRAARCGWRTLKLLMTTKAGTAPAPAVMQGAMDGFQAVSVATAQRVLRFSIMKEVV